MQIAKNSVVTIHYELTDAEGNQLEKGDPIMSYVHGGYDGVFPLVEEALHGKTVGDAVSVRMGPDDAFGEYDENLMRVEPRDMFPANVAVGMQFEGGAEGEDDEDYILYTVTDIADDKVIVDGNHPLAGMTLNFKCTVTEVRQATQEELTHGHVHGEHGHVH
ncbi:MAG: peptidylprolyl isomerase [Burkholderiales bacterium]